MSSFAPLQPKRARLASPVRQPASSLRLSSDLKALKFSSSEPGPTPDRLHTSHFSLAHIPIVSPKISQTGLPNDLKAHIEKLSGLSMRNVKVHYFSHKPAQVQALAYTQGTNIYIGPGQEKHLPHEAWHVVQQMQGRVRPIMQDKGIAINDDQELEREADGIGNKVASIGEHQPLVSGDGLADKTAYALAGNVIQRVNGKGKKKRKVIEEEEGEEYEEPERPEEKKRTRKEKASEEKGTKKIKPEMVEEEGEEYEEPERPEEKKRNRRSGLSWFDELTNLVVEQEALQERRQTRGQKQALKEHKQSRRKQKKEDPVLARITGSDRDTINKSITIYSTLVMQSNDPDSGVEMSHIKAIFQPVQDKYNAYQSLIEKDSDRTTLNQGKDEFVRAVKQAIGDAWASYSEVLPHTLQPAGEVFAEREFTGSIDDSKRRIYFTGEDENNAIPIVWYKPPSAYPSIKTTVDIYSLQSGVDVKIISKGPRVTISKTLLKPDIQNLPPSKPAPTESFFLKKSAHNESREGQKNLNKDLNDYAEVFKGNRWIKNALSTLGGFDGDHIKDLGFGGKDDKRNYWPLAAKINRRAFNGYNSQYIVNYKKSDGSLASKPVGGLIGKYFKVKGYLKDTDSAIPAESGKPFAGTWEKH